MRPQGRGELRDQPPRAADGTPQTPANELPPLQDRGELRDQPPRAADGTPQTPANELPPLQGREELRDQPPRAADGTPQTPADELPPLQGREELRDQPHEPRTGHRRPRRRAAARPLPARPDTTRGARTRPVPEGSPGQDVPAVHEDEPGFTLDPENGMDKTLAVWRRKIARGRKACAGLPDGMTGA
ncbi:hypothetical protein ACFQV4_04075 [Streptomyces thermocarboxydus]